MLVYVSGGQIRLDYNCNPRAQLRYFFEKRKIWLLKQLDNKMSEGTKKHLERSTDPEIWMKWYHELSSEEESAMDEEDEDEVEDDNLEHSEHQTESEQELSSDEDQGTPSPDVYPEGELEPNSNTFYLGKDKTTKWRKSRANLQVRVRSHNIMKLFPGLKRNARDAVSEIDCIKLFLTENIIQMITASTNIYIEKIKNKFQRDRDARLTDEREISAFIGILFLIGTLRSSRKNAHKIWDNSKGSGVELCYLAMSEKRFRFLLRTLRFDDIRTRSDRREVDKFAPIREIFEIFLANFQNNFIPSEFLTVDEQLLAFRGRCSFKQYIPSKPARYGIKVFALVDAKTAYTFNLEPYVGTQPDGPYKFSNSPDEIVLRLVHPVEGTNRNITGDNWFTSIPLVKKLLEEKKLTYVGTLRKNKREIPLEFLPKKDREEATSYFGFHDKFTMVSYCPKKNRAVILISSMHHDNSIDLDAGEKKLPEIITCYNKTKIGVDMVDQMCEKYNVARTTNRWPMVVFYDLLNISAINATCVYKANHPEKKVLRSDFIESFAWELIKPQIEHRSTIPNVPKEIRRRARHLLGLEEILPPPPPDIPANFIRRCYICSRSRNKSTRKICQKCNKHACKDHMRDVCTACLSE
ncbi:unnamed protein product [Callosobruchus maculatus]|uniref:PiggyBac transposable element-derived protein domain-containing protein n=2 Tax=Callosobruchus maculatus TaxID=64391 RepID=A0A653BWW5_CALMS|nr:unnamed protein product [Callosobruchus maculatus]